ncbi:unnamed protein product [Prorocentrum cordatum]|uniref:Uncharacterized protein n=1 Tax=Prorocentrum cordatum TaxID=2364126 RepID=A0ABN9V6E4_9DINO|nr:unnamed protein product [Polarella glacialis]
MDEMRSKLDEKQKERQKLQHEADAATQESSKHSLYFGQILMSVENIHIRCKEQGKGIQHNVTHIEDEAGGPLQGGGARGADPQQEEPEDSFRRKKDEACRQLKIILNYLKDFKDITDQLKKGSKALDPLKQRQAMLSEAPTFSGEDVKFITGEPLWLWTFRLHTQGSAWFQYGAQAYGVAPSVVIRTQSAIWAVLGGPKEGSCVTTYLALKLGQSMPAVELVLRHFVSFSELTAAWKNIHASRRAWKLNPAV